jgi:tetratricopeptide (TPR) repeat protein
VSAIEANKERHVIPRWRDSFIAGALGELDPASKKLRDIAHSGTSLQEKLEDWAVNRKLAFAADVIGAALTLGKFEEADEAAKYVLSRKEDATLPLRHLAKRVLNATPSIDVSDDLKFDKGSLSATVRKARRRLHQDPRNAIAWTDLARAYASLGYGEKAKRAMKLANSLARTNRFVTRSAARLHVHLGEADYAHSLLRRSDLVKSDPWIVAAEIAAADLEGKISRFVRRGREMLESGNFPPFHTAELACAIGSLELKSGSGKRARRFFRSALVKPTENSLAQIEWASAQLPDFILSPSEFELPFSHEARARYSFAAADWQRTVAESVIWFADEPFASQSAILGSYVAAEHIGDFEAAASIAQQGLVASPEEATLWNNYAFALGSQGKVIEAAEALSHISLATVPIHTQICYFATEGLINFRSGDPQGGREAYNKAIQLARAAQFAKYRARAAVNLAQEELRIGTNQAREAVLNAIDESRVVADDELRHVLQRLRDIVVQRADALGEIDTIVNEVTSLIRPAKLPLQVKEDSTRSRIPLM